MGPVLKGVRRLRGLDAEGLSDPLRAFRGPGASFFDVACLRVAGMVLCFLRFVSSISGALPSRPMESPAARRYGMSVVDVKKLAKAGGNSCVTCGEIARFRR